MPVVRTDGQAACRYTVTWLPNFLGWVVYHICLPMVLRCARFARESFAITTYVIYISIVSFFNSRLVQCKLSLLLCCRYWKACLTWWFSFTWPVQTAEKRLQLPYSVSDAGTETSFCMKDVSFWAVASHEWRKKQETIQQERKLKEWNISLQRQTDLKLKWWFIYYNRRYRSVYWLK